MAPVSPETYNFMSSDHIEHVALCIEVLFRLGWRDVSDGAYRRFDASLSQTFRVAIGQILPAAVRMVNQSTFLDGTSIMQACSKASRTKLVLADRVTRQHTMRSANV
jgi:hypothetical protein